MKKMKLFFQVKPLCKVEVEFTSVNTPEAGIDTGGLGRKITTLLYNSLPGKFAQGMENKVLSTINTKLRISFVLASLWPWQFFMDMNHQTS